jgi:hypothetical protein
VQVLSAGRTVRRDLFRAFVHVALKLALEQHFQSIVTVLGDMGKRYVFTAVWQGDAAWTKPPPEARIARTNYHLRGLIDVPERDWQATVVPQART